MKEIHKKLSERFSWYASWHQKPEHHMVHYGILAIFFAASSLWMLSKTTLVQSADQPGINRYAPFNDLKFKDRMGGKKELLGDEAVSALGSDVDRVANHYGFTGAELKKQLKQTKTLRVNQDALLFYSEEVLSASLGDGTIPNNPTVDDIADADTFFLHSNPTSTAKVYLNFVGGTVTTPYWNGGNPITLAPYSQDSDPAFSIAELNAIQAMWLGVSEDYAPFTVDITTEKPTSYDQSHYTEIYITPSSSWYGNSGGVAYIGSYTWGLNIPGFVFSTLLGNNSKYVADAISHEVGHTVSLYHSSLYDAGCNYISEYAPGSGSNPGWAPIMGNSYSKGVAQWIDSSEWPLISTSLGCNSEVNQFTKMVSGGLVFRADDAGDTTANAGPLVRVVAGGIANVDHLGYLNPGDTDMFKIDSTSGTIDLSVAPMTPLGTNFIGNNDFRVRLISSSGAVLAESNPPAVGIAAINVPVTAGTYYLQIVSSGYLDVTQAGGYTATGSAGRYNVKGTYPVDVNAGDTTAPIVSVTSPSTGATVSGIVTLAASATDAVGVTRVEFYRGGVFLGSDTSAPYNLSWNTATMANGSVTLSAKAYDLAGNVGNSSNISVSVNNAAADTVAPVATISSPAYGTVISSKTTGVVIKGSATDNSGVIVRNDLLINNTIVASNTNTSSISYKWNTRKLAVGTYTIVLRSYDAAGNIGQATVVVTR